MKKALIIIAVVLTCFSAAFAQNSFHKKIYQIESLVSEKKYEEALVKLDKVLQLDITQNNDTINAVCVALKGNILFNQEKYLECIPVFKQACNLFERAHYINLGYFDALLFIATSYHFLEDYENAERYYRKVLLKSASYSDEDLNEYCANAYLNLGDLYKKKGQEKLAESCYEKAQSYRGQTYDIDVINFKVWQNSLWDKINHYIPNQQYQEAVDVYSEMVSGIVEKIGKGDEYAFAVYSKALLQRAYLNKFDEASSLFKEIIDFKDSLSFPNNEVCGSYCNYALCLAIKKDSDEIERILPVAISYLTQAHNERYPVNAIYRFIGNGAYWNSDYSTAIKYYEQYLAPGFQKEDGYNYDEITNMLAVSYILTNKLEKAQALLEKYLSDNSKKLDDNQELASQIYHNLGHAYMLQNKKNIALKYLNFSKKIQLRLYKEVSSKTQQYISECEKQ